jgi:hypothetical protein
MAVEVLSKVALASSAPGAVAAVALEVTVMGKVTDPSSGSARNSVVEVDDDCCALEGSSERRPGLSECVVVVRLFVEAVVSSAVVVTSTTLVFVLPVTVESPELLAMFEVPSGVVVATILVLIAVETEASVFTSVQLVAVDFGLSDV